MRQGRTGIFPGFENRCGGRYRMRSKGTSGVGGCSEDDGHLTQARGKDRIGFVIAARNPIRFREQKIDADNPRRCCYMHQPGELIARPRPLSDMTN